MSGVSKDSGAVSVRAQLNSREMSLAQWEVVFLCTAINMLDGYDVLVMSFAAAPVASDWRLDPASLGLASAGLIGMGLGSIMLGSLADALGRKRLVHICLITVTIGMIASAYTQSQQQLQHFVCHRCWHWRHASNSDHWCQNTQMINGAVSVWGCFSQAIP